MPRTLIAGMRPALDRLDDVTIAAQLQTDQWIYLVIGPQVWGRGFSLEQAYQAAGRPRKLLIFASADPWATITGMGDICYTPRPAPVCKAHERQDCRACRIPAPPTYIEIARRE